MNQPSDNFYHVGRTHDVPARHKIKRIKYNENGFQFLDHEFKLFDVVVVGAVESVVIDKVEGNVRTRVEVQCFISELGRRDGETFRYHHSPYTVLLESFVILFLHHDDRTWSRHIKLTKEGFSRRN